MGRGLILVRLDTDYCNYLRRYDDKVPYNFKLLEEKCFKYNK